MLTGWLRYLRGDLLSTRELIEGLLERVAFIGPISLAFATFLHAELDEPDPARQHLERIAAGDFADVPRDEGWLMTMAIAGETCAYLGDRRRAASHYQTAIESSQSIGARPHRARAECACARLLFDAEPISPGDRTRARDMLARAEDTARELGMKRLAELARAPGRKRC